MIKIKNWNRILIGFLYFWISGKTQDKAYQAMLGLFCSTGGRSNDLISKILSKIRGKKDFQLSADRELQTVKWSEILKRDGIVSLGTYLSNEDCAKIEKWARENSAAPKPRRQGLPELVVPTPDDPIAEGYYFSEQQIIDQQNIQMLMTDKNIINLAQNYLGCEPILSIVAMWWSCSGKFSEDASRALAQMYHFDMDRPKWLKVFFYINDVSLKNGPHVFIRKTHKTGNFPQPLLAKGYSRLTDNEINQYFSEEDQLKIVGPRGSAFAEDTRGIHKGLIPENGYRLVLQLEFSNSLFGAKYEKDLKLKKTLLSRESLKFIENHPKIYSRFQVVE